MLCSKNFSRTQSLSFKLIKKRNLLNIQFYVSRASISSRSASRFQNKQQNSNSNVRASILFTGGVVVGSFAIAAYWSASERWKIIESQQRRFPFGVPVLFGNEGTIPPQPITRPVTTAAVWALIGINVAVFGAWQVPRLAPFMKRHFVHYPNSPRVYTMLTSAFSHQSFIHLLFNTMVLYDFGTSIHYQLGLNTPLFLAFYASAGTLSSLGSRLVSLLYKTASVSRGSVGASGALYALVAMNAYLHPDWKVSLIILPGVDFSMGQLVPCLLLLDVVGIFRRWQMFDHAAHVAGAAAGLGFITYGREYWNILQGKLDQEHFKRRKGE